MQQQEFTTQIGGVPLTATFSDLVDQAGSAVVVTYGETVVMATATMSKHAREGGDFFPLVVDYEERFYAAGKILGSRYVRREGRPSTEATLKARMIDRTIRPLFPQHIRHDVQVVITILSLGDYDPDVVAINAASIALATSPIPWNGPASAVRIAADRTNNWHTNPTYEVRRGDLALDAIICGRENEINMIDANAWEATEETMTTALTTAEAQISALQAFQHEIIGTMKQEKVVIEKEVLSDDEKALFTKEITPKLDEAVFSGTGKQGIGGLEEAWLTLFAEHFPESKKSLARRHYDEAVNDLLHTQAIDHARRPDGRPLDQIRTLYAQAGGVSPALHGTGIFYRGGTHVLSVLTLGAPSDAQTVETIEHQEDRRYMHHYNFPPYSVGETGRIGGTNRRMVGHGALAEKALLPVLPTKEDFPYTMRVVSEAVASNGSTSMASTCGSTIALMDGGVPITAPVGGMAMGIMYRDSEHYAILTDIQGPEDHHGDIDLKVAGTRTGITAIQMDVKVDGIPVKVLSEAMAQAKVARMTVIDTIEAEIATPRPAISDRAPHIISMSINPEKIGQVIGSGGKTVSEIIKKTGTEINIEDDGSIFISGSHDGADTAREIIEQITHEFKTGERFEGEVVKILDFGAFVRINPYAEGLVHISELAPVRIEKVTDLLKEGDRVPVAVKEVDSQGRLNLSIKRADENFFKEKLTTQPTTNN